MTVDAAYHMMYTGALAVFALLIGCMLVRSILGPEATDRILSVNMIGTMVIGSILVLSRLLGEGYLADVALIYALISFVSVLIMASVYIPADASEDKVLGRRKRKKRRKEAEMTFRRGPAPEKGEDA